MALQHCFLHCMSDRHDPIELPHNEALIIGRNPRTRIIDKLVSRQHGKYNLERQ